MARQPRTPGVAEAPKAIEPELVQTPVSAQDDAALDAILGTPESKDAAPAAEPVQAEPTAEDLQAKSEYEEFLEWRKNKAGLATTAPVAQHVPTSGVHSELVVKRTRPVLGPNGWTSEEY